MLKGLAFHPHEQAWKEAEEFVKNNPGYCIVAEIESGYPQIMTEKQRDEIARVWEECKPKPLSNQDMGKIIVFGTGGGIEKGSKDFNDVFYNEDNR